MSRQNEELKVGDIVDFTDRLTILEIKGNDIRVRNSFDEEYWTTKDNLN
ncbi:hypothetical protein [Listeria booriae]|nr:hypothetical protein [Listeria booriae]MBC2173952.1 hypothetical protein [Listeria booriae]MBC2258866.1 hypothetical protein [Listeria booriae]MBC6151066.1 hypothetical protein [Listeria booriae]MBC6151185.1 hypothetical protein [Listeria booriae]